MLSKAAEKSLIIEKFHTLTELKLFTPYVWHDKVNRFAINPVFAVSEDAVNIIPKNFQVGFVEGHKDVFMFLTEPSLERTESGNDGELFCAKVIGLQKPVFGWMAWSKKYSGFTKVLLSHHHDDDKLDD